MGAKTPKTKQREPVTIDSLVHQAGDLPIAGGSLIGRGWGPPPPFARHPRLDLQRRGVPVPGVAWVENGR